MRHKTTTFILIASLMLTPSRVLAQQAESGPLLKAQADAGDTSEVDEHIRLIDRQILLELVHLAKFNAQYELAANHVARWRNIVYPAAQEAAYACFLGYSLNDLHQRSIGWNNPRLISPTAVKRGIATVTVGSLLGSTSSLVEIAANGGEYLRQRRHGFAAGQSLTTVESLTRHVDEMLLQRQSLMRQSNSVGIQHEILELKGQLLQYERERLAFEFKRWYQHSRGYAWYKNTFYVINSTVNSLRFVAGMAGYKSFSDKRFNGATGPTLTTAATLGMLGPATSAFVRNRVEQRQKKILDRRIPTVITIDGSEAKQKFERLAELAESNQIGSITPRVAAELINLRREKAGLDTLILNEEKTIQRFRKVAGLQARLAPVSSLGIASGILSTVGYHGYRQKPIISTRLGLAGDVCIIPAEGIALLATPAASLVAALYEHRLRRAGTHPDQLLSQRVKDLETMENVLNEAWR